MQTHPAIREYIANREIDGALEEAFTDGEVSLYVGIENNGNPAPVEHAIAESGGEIVESNQDLRLFTVRGPTGLIEKLLDIPNVDQLEPAVGDLMFSRYDSFVADPIKRKTTRLDLGYIVEQLDGVLYHLDSANDRDFTRETTSAKIYLSRLLSHFGIDEVTANPYLDTAFEGGKWITIIVTYDADQREGEATIEPRPLSETTVDDARKFANTYQSQATIGLSIKADADSLELKTRVADTYRAFGLFG